MGLLYDHLCNHAATRQNASQDVDYQALRAVPVFEISNVLGLFADWEVEKNRPIPKRPPETQIWVEWDTASEDDGLGFVIYAKVGCIICTVERGAYPAIPSATGNPADLGDLPDLLDASDRLFVAYPFLRFDRTEGAKPPQQVRGQFGRIFQHRQGLLAVSLENDCRVELRAFEIRDEPFFGLPMPEKLFDVMDVCQITWPPFMAFSLLHCKNVRAEVVPPEPEEHAERNRKRGLPPKREYHVLRLELPGDLRPRPATADEEESERKMRFHLCRGHFKNLQHERFKAKGWHWWPAHWRGSKDLGWVDKSYELHARSGATE